MQKHVAITGMTGLVGINLANRLAAQGYVVYGLLRDEPSNLYIDPKINKVYGNINSMDDVTYFLKKSNPDYIFHLAAQTQAHESITYPYEAFYTNFVGSLNILEASRLHTKASAIIVASSDKAYGELEGESYVESTPLNGVYPYDASKVSVEVLARSYKETYNMPIVVTRSCNVYGTGDNNTQRLISGIFKAYLSGEDFILRNGGRDVREYVHVNDVVEAYLKIAEHTATEDIYTAFNISSGDKYSSMEVFKLMENAIGEEVSVKVVFDDSLEIKNQAMSSELLRNVTGWKPEIRFEDGIADIVAWYMNNTQ